MGYYSRLEGFESCSFEDLKGKTLVSVKVEEDEIYLQTACGFEYKLYHDQDCCESVYVESVTGNTIDLIGEPLLLAEEVSNAEFPHDKEYEPESYTWTFYKLATRMGYVDIRFFGSSNGYYSEGVYCVRRKVNNGTAF